MTKHQVPTRVPSRVLCAFAPSWLSINEEQGKTGWNACPTDERITGCPRWYVPSSSRYFTMLLSLKIGRMMLIAMTPTTLPMATIMIGSIMAVTDLMTSFNSRL